MWLPTSPICSVSVFRSAVLLALQLTIKYTSLSKLLPKSWVVHEEIQMHRTGLRLDLVPASCMITAGRSLPDDHGYMISVGRLQPDMVLVFRTLEKVGLLEICSPMDESSSQLQAAIARKLRTYASLLTALKPYLDVGISKLPL